MRKLSRTSHAVLSAATLLLFAFAGAQADAFQRHLQRLDSFALRSQGLSAPAALHRLTAARSHYKLLKTRGTAGNGIADSAIVSFAHRLHFAGVTSAEVLGGNKPSRLASVLPRAPPLS